MLISEYQTILDYELQQEMEFTDSGLADKYRILPTTQTLRIINESINELMILNKSRFESTWQKFFSGFEDEYEYYEIPSGVYKVLALKFNDGDYFIPSGDIIKTELYIEHDKLIVKASGNFEIGDTITIKYIGFTPHTETTQELGFPDEFIRLLTLHIKRKAYGRKNKLLPQLEFAEYSDLKRLWSIDSGLVRKKSRLSFNGFEFGRR